MRAYTIKLADRWSVFIETPVGTWVELKGFGRTEAEAKDWIIGMQYRLVTKAESYLPA